jgi:NTE family protein
MCPPNDFAAQAPTTGKMGLVLSGGGARGAYQAGVMKAVGQITKELGLLKPIQIITGVSAGAVNAAYLASMADNFTDACNQMADMWMGITTDQVFRTDALSAGRSGLKFLSDITVGALYKKKLARSLLDTSPLSTFLEKNIDFERINKNISSGHVGSLAVTAMNYSNATSITFVHGAPETPMWKRSRRISVQDQVTASHVMASAAIPLFFPPVKLGDDHYGDGCLRNTAPLSPAIHLGADRLLVISVRRPDGVDPTSLLQQASIEPSLARILGVILNALLLDAIDVDMERMSRINSTLNLVPEQQRSDLSLRKMDFLWLRPSRDIGNLAGDLFHKLPNVIRYLIGGLGSSREASELTSYLLFDPEFCGRLVELGYNDGLENREKIIAFLQGA